MNIMLALLKREVLEHRNIWFVPLILVGIAILVRFSMSFGNLSIDFDVPSQLQLDDQIDSVVTGVVARALNWMNFNIARVIMIVACFYTLSCLYNERQDQSVLFWRSLPVSDATTIASKLAIALVVAPNMVVLTQTVVAFVFFGLGAFEYLSVFFESSLSVLMRMIVWSLIPTVAWCLFCSEIASKNPFLLAFVAPVLFWIVDSMFLDGTIGNIVQVNRWINFNDYSTTSLASGLIIAAVFIVLATVKRSQRI